MNSHSTLNLLPQEKISPQSTTKTHTHKKVASKEKSQKANEAVHIQREHIDDGDDYENYSYDEDNSDDEYESALI
uniref:Uncharacterized protein n=1 Tax=Strongyloides venezuelensis TaxID=75913 RepID=A0A0K0FF25_STRVS